MSVRILHGNGSERLIVQCHCTVRQYVVQVPPYGSPCCNSVLESLMSRNQGSPVLVALTRVARSVVTSCKHGDRSLAGTCRQGSCVRWWVSAEGISSVNHTSNVLNEDLSHRARYSCSVHTHQLVETPHPTSVDSCGTKVRTQAAPLVPRYRLSNRPRGW